MITIQQVLDHYKREHPFEPGEECENRDTYYWLSGLLHDVEKQVLTNLCNAGSEFPGATPDPEKWEMEITDLSLAPSENIQIIPQP